MEKDGQLYYGSLKTRDLYILTLSVHVMIVVYILDTYLNNPSFISYLLSLFVALFFYKTPMIVLDEKNDRDALPHHRFIVMILSSIISISGVAPLLLQGFKEGHMYAWFLSVIPVYCVFTLIYLWWLHKRKKLIIDTGNE